ncbi:alpha/beta hydrolase family protein [Kutzneria chonburiensis]|uniref:Alpha/beta hydrolase family protein n=1 Tax=Kutzneria chonburiensis TaxID=1483604 RepID=A0ABV6MRQ6_9PSEU|nr:chlorophyllase [Kutzneria chonburiensis]
MTTTAPVLSYSPLTLAMPGRPVDLQVRVSSPATGTDLPVIVFSHGHGATNNLSSLNGYAPIVSLWAAAGFVVVQPTHLDSATLRDQLTDVPGAPLFADERPTDLIHIIDRLDEIERAVPLLQGRIDHDKIAVAGHSYGAWAASILLGANGDLLDPRVKAGVLLGAPGRGGDVLNGPMAEAVPFMRVIDYSTMTTPALIVYGDRDDSQHFTDLGPDWHADPYHLSPAPKAMLTVVDSGHILGGISGYDSTESAMLDDENPAQVEAIGRLTAAYLHAQFDKQPWPAAPDPIGRVITKS